MMLTVLTAMPHVIFGVLGILAAVWVLVELLNLSERNLGRLKTSSLLTSVFIWLSYLLGGWWYVKYYASDKSVILKSAFTSAHTFYMEGKEHIFFILLFLSVLLPITIYKNPLLTNNSFKRLAIIITVLIILLGFGMEGAGSMIVSGVKIGLLGGK